MNLPLSLCFLTGVSDTHVRVCVDIFVTHKSQLESVVDMAVHMGSKHNISGVEFVHTKPFYMLAMETSKSLGYFPAFEQAHAVDSSLSFPPTTRRRAQACPDPTCYSTSWSCCSCMDNTCGMSGSCGSDCTGMCGPSCSQCWYWICDTCCWTGFCNSHDNCCGQVGFYTTTCWVRDSFFGNVHMCIYNICLFIYIYDHRCASLLHCPNLMKCLCTERVERLHGRYGNILLQWLRLQSASFSWLRRPLNRRNRNSLVEFKARAI